MDRTAKIAAAVVLATLMAAGAVGLAYAYASETSNLENQLDATYLSMSQERVFGSFQNEVVWNNSQDTADATKMLFWTDRVLDQSHQMIDPQIVQDRIDLGSGKYVHMRTIGSATLNVLGSGDTIPGYKLDVKVSGLAQHRYCFYLEVVSENLDESDITGGMDGYGNIAAFPLKGYHGATEDVNPNITTTFVIPALVGGDSDVLTVTLYIMDVVQDSSDNQDLIDNKQAMRNLVVPISNGIVSKDDTPKINSVTTSEEQTTVDDLVFVFKATVEDASQ